MVVSSKFWAVILFLGILSIGITTADAQEPTPTTPAPDCAECHLDVVADWQNSVHAQAYHDPNFQAAWQEKNGDSMCLACHTTGFSARTGDYDQAGITCTACHGETPMTHPPDPVSVSLEVEVCADCHATTFNEWKMSLHGEQQLACATCHTPHNQSLRFETANALCLNCHDEARDDYAHVSHPDQACVDCHWYRSLDETAHVMTGNLMPTGHDSQVETRTCVDCHASLAASETGEIVPVSSSQHPLLEAQVKIDELEAEVETTRAEGENQAAVQLIAGLLIGGVVTGLGLRGISSLWRRGG